MGLHRGTTETEQILKEYMHLNKNQTHQTDPTSSVWRSTSQEWQLAQMRLEHLSLSQPLADSNELRVPNGFSSSQVLRGRPHCWPQINQPQFMHMGGVPGFTGDVSLLEGHAAHSHMNKLGLMNMELTLVCCLEALGQPLRGFHKAASPASTASGRSKPCCAWGSGLLERWFDLRTPKPSILGQSSRDNKSVSDHMGWLCMFGHPSWFSVFWRDAKGKPPILLFTYFDTSAGKLWPFEPWCRVPQLQSWRTLFGFEGTTERKPSRCLASQQMNLRTGCVQIGAGSLGSSFWGYPCYPASPCQLRVAAETATRSWFGNHTFINLPRDLQIGFWSRNAAPSF